MHGSFSCGRKSLEASVKYATLNKGDLLLLLNGGDTSVSSCGKVVISTWAEFGSTVDSSPGGITDTGTGSSGIPSDGSPWDLSSYSKSSGKVVEDSSIS
jgi:hypothetical protein